MRKLSLFLALLILSTTTTAFASGLDGLPDFHRTPGAIDPSVTQENIGRTVCVVGYTKTVRPPTSYTNKLKYEQLRSGYAVNGDLDMRNYEEDHLIPLAVGGSPRDPRNLFPQYYGGAYGARLKDRLELKMHLLVCAGSVTLKAAQSAFKKDWRIAYRKYIGPLN
ncbi:unannotated protein [freshwater metagenome]|uniref:Unannotated protein n=1 Tax=freshwater metagenome TaxID=449393 RepID=A0A6J6BHW7_9ZZZZ|nr:hypothetical protein [Actinomycetota bacterium]MSW98751.1 hypothetical protein [Actinomycetota bacterium]MSY81876.1 hypothetical protein [Actinomycetota bacterium]MSZ45848.1 hypothetical protein [Actinomycetota bacterium]MTA04868.1 hypothetical protein [Actinomycetota bacterium]